MKDMIIHHNISLKILEIDKTMEELKMLVLQEVIIEIIMLTGDQLVDKEYKLKLEEEIKV